MIKRTLFVMFILITFIGNMYPQKSPDEFFGFKIGSDLKLVKYPDIIRYFEYLDSGSKRIKLSDEGRSTLGNSMRLAFISSEENIRQLQSLVEINKKLANPDSITADEALSLQKKAKVFVLITCSIHATEIGASQMSMLFAFKLATTKDPKLNEYLDNVVIMLMPSINPDGNIMVSDWFDKYVGTEYEGCPMPYLYHHYAGHDNNRDFYMLNLKESQVVNAVLHHRYFPHIFLDMHQMDSTGPRIFVPPFNNPLNQNLEPLLMRETDIIGYFMALKLQEKEKKGVASSYGFDAYWPGGSKNTAWYKNVVGLLTELASVKTAAPVYIESNELDVSSKGLQEYKAQVNFPDPWKGGWWRLRDIIDYEMIAVEGLLEISSKNKDSFLSNFYNLGISNVEKGNTLAPYGYVIPLEQWDILTTYTFLSKMEEGGVRIFKMDADARVGDMIYKKGSFIIPMNQPYRNFIKVMMERQDYPLIKQIANGPIIEPYDACGWTLPLQMGVKTFELNSPLDGMPISRVSKITFPGEAITGKGNFYCFPTKLNRSAIVVNRLLEKGIKVFRYTGESNGPVQPGDFFVKEPDISSDGMLKILKGTGVGVTKRSINDPVSLKELIKSRIGIYRSYRANIDEGWTRWVLDEFEFPYTTLHNKDFDPQNGDLSKRMEIIVFPSMNRDIIVDGVRIGDSRTDSASALPPEYKGGIGAKGVEALVKFAKEGGTVILLDSSSELGIKDFSLPFSNILKDVKSDKFYCPGSILGIQVDTMDPIGWGLEHDNILYFSDSSTFKTRIPALKSIDRKVVASFKDLGPHLLSGYLKGGELLDRAAMILRFDYYKGHIIVLGGRTQNRGQTFSTFKFIFNALYYPGLMGGNPQTIFH